MANCVTSVKDDRRESTNFGTSSTGIDLRSFKSAPERIVSEYEDVILRKKKRGTTLSSLKALANGLLGQVELMGTHPPVQNAPSTSLLSITTRALLLNFTAAILALN